MSSQSGAFTSSKTKQTKGKKSKDTHSRPKKETSKHIANHIDTLRQLCKHEESEIFSDAQMSECVECDPIAVGEPLSFDKAIKMEYGMLNDLQLEVTASYLNGEYCKSISSRLHSQGVAVSEKSIKTCVVRTVLGYQWEPHMTGGTQTNLAFLDEFYLISHIRENLQNGKALDVGDVRRLAEILFLGRKAAATNIINSSNLTRGKKHKITTSFQEKVPPFEDCWCRSFLERHDLNLVSAEFLEEQRVKYGTSGVIIRWFKQFETVLKSYPSHLVYNMDEMNINFSATEKIIVTKGNKSFLAKPKTSTLPHITACCAFNGIGQEMPLFVLMKEFKLSPEINQLIECGIIDLSFSPNGWMTRQSFMLWSKKFIDFVEKTSDSSTPKLLLVDSHNSRECSEALEYLRDHNVTVLTYPPHLTHILQPFDVVVARSFKAKFRSFFKKYQKQFEDNRSSTKLYVLILALTAAWKASINVAVSITSFSITGLIPYNPNNPLASPYTRNSSEDAEMAHDCCSRLRTSSRILTNEDYITELKKRKCLQQMPSNIKTSVDMFCKMAAENLPKSELIQIKNILSFQPKKFLAAVEQMIDTEEFLYETSPIAMFYNVSMLKECDLSHLDERVKRFIHTSTIPKETTYKDKVRQSLAIAEHIMGNKIPDFSLEDAFRREADRLGDAVLKRWNCIVESLEKISNYNISDIYQALWVLARLGTGTLESYQEDHETIPDDPIADFLDLKKLVIDEEESQTL